MTVVGMEIRGSECTETHSGGGALRCRVSKRWENERKGISNQISALKHSSTKNFWVKNRGNSISGWIKADLRDGRKLRVHIRWGAYICGGEI